MLPIIIFSMRRDKQMKQATCFKELMVLQLETGTEITAIKCGGDDEERTVTLPSGTHREGSAEFFWPQLF